MDALPVAIIGAGPQGLAMAAHLAERGIECTVFERGPAAGSAVAEWGHVRLFSAWDELVDAAALRRLTPLGWQPPARRFPTGAQWIEHYLAPLAASLGDIVRTNTTVTGVSRVGRDKLVSEQRGDQPFVLHLTSSEGREDRFLARAVIDASGTWSLPAPLGAHGLPAIGERAAQDVISYRIPVDVAHLAGQHVAVVGAGHSATHTILMLDALARSHPSTKITWALRRGSSGNIFGGGAADALPARAELGTRAQRAVAAGRVSPETGFRVAGVTHQHGSVSLTSEDGRTIDGLTHVFAHTGFRPDFSILRELRTATDPILDAVAGIADEIDPNLHSCGSVGATGAKELTQPDPDFYIVGAKSYGRAPTFLALTGYEQVRSVAAHLAGDFAAAERNELVLPDTGVCGGAVAFDAPNSSCCSVPAQMQGLIPLGLSPTSSDCSPESTRMLS